MPGGRRSPAGAGGGRPSRRRAARPAAPPAKAAADPVLAAARALSDGREIEWERLAATIPAFADRLRQLRVIQSIAQACAAPLPLAAADVGPDGAPERRDGAGPPARPDGGPEDREIGRAHV